MSYGRQTNAKSRGNDRVRRASWQIWRDRRGYLSALRVATLALLLTPLVKAVVEASEIAHGARPLNELIHRAGFWALVFLGLTLAVMPFRQIDRKSTRLNSSHT